METGDIFFQFVEQWATKYKPMRHDKVANCRFFLCDGMAGMADMMRTINPDSTPCVQMESAEEGKQTERFNYHDYTLYFCARANNPSDGEEARRTKFECGGHKDQFILYLRSKLKWFQQQGWFPDMDSIGYTTIGPIFDGWNAVQIQINVGEAVNQCLDKELLEE